MEWLTKESKEFLYRDYLFPNETPESRLWDIAKHAEEILNFPFADQFYENLSRGFYSLSSPVWSNFGKDRGFPVSCFGSYIPDNLPGILYTQSEVGMMSKIGGGSSGYIDLRPRGSRISNNGTTSGAVHFMKLFDTMTDVVSQGSMRRGRFAGYLDVTHPDIDEFLNIGSEGSPLQEIKTGVVIPDSWMKSMVEGDVEKRKIWAKILSKRTENGFPYIVFKDNANENTPYKDTEYEIRNSNLCSEIMLPVTETESFVCVLSSMNLAKYDEWKDTNAVELLVYFLDAVLTDFINGLEEMRDSSDPEKRDGFYFLLRTYNFAKKHRALGLGALGWHSLLQKKMIPWESKEASILNKKVFEQIQDQSYKASKFLADKFGEPEMLKGKGRRNMTLNAIAPTASSSFILGQVSQGIEPLWSNAYVRDTAKVKSSYKNPELKSLLESKGLNNEETWRSIRDHNGSVQHLDFLTDLEKDVFKTFEEIDPWSILYQAAIRQGFLDQSQSLNSMIPSDMNTKDLNKWHLDAWKLGLKSLYYQNGTNAAQDFNRKRMNGECKGCEA